MTATPPPVGTLVVGPGEVSWRPAGGSTSLLGSDDLSVVTASERHRRPRWWHRPPPERQVHPGRTVVARVRGGEIQARTADQSRWVTLEQTELDLALALDGPRAEGELALQVGAPAARITVAVDRLAMAGIVSVGSHDPAHTTDRPLGDAGTATDVLADLSQGSAVPRSDPSGRIPVLSFWATNDGPPVGVAAVLAYARVHDGGVLNERFDLRRMASPAQVLADLDAHDGPAVLLCGNYVWSVDANQEVARQARERCPELIVVHGGPDTPTGEDGADYLAPLGPGHVIVAGEGELTFAHLLDALGREDAGPFDPRRLAEVAGVRYLDPDDGSFVSTGARPRHDDLSQFPSPFLSGELELVPSDQLNVLAIETNRGCPYRCTFCDWGGATMSRIRQFPMERVRAELQWMADHQIATWYFADANFGILPRDLDIARQIVDHRHAVGFPELVVIFPSKKVTDRYLTIMEELHRSGIVLRAALALQTRDEATLAAVRRSNIRNDSYDRLALESRRRGIPMVTELMLGLPGSTIASLKADLQWCIDHELRAFLYDTVALPNAPMSQPDYQEELAIRTVDGRLVSTSSYTEADRELMGRLGLAYNCLEVLGSLRPALRYLQWDLGMAAMDVIEGVLLAVEAAPERYPLLDFHLHCADATLLVPVGWEDLLDEARSVLVEHLGVPDDQVLTTVLRATQHLLLWPGRPLPATVELDHDYVAWLDDQRQHHGDDPTAAARPLASYPPGPLVLDGDPYDALALFGRWDDNDPFVQAHDFEPESRARTYRSAIGEAASEAEPRPTELLGTSP